MITKCHCGCISLYICLPYVAPTCLSSNRYWIQKRREAAEPEYGYLPSTPHGRGHYTCAGIPTEASLHWNHHPTSERPTTAERILLMSTTPAKRRLLDGQGVNIDRGPQEVSCPGPSRALSKAVEITEDYALQVGERFAASGHADIHKATVTLSGGTECQVAVKVLRLHGTVGSPGAYENSLTRIDKRLRRELEIWKRLSHPCITPLLAYIESSSRLLPGSGAGLISPYRKNGNLLIYLSKKPSADKLLLLQQVCEGLTYIHTLEPPVIHLDLKPENILSNDEEEAELCDFGLAKALEEARTGFTTSTPGGTVIYMAPEALNGDSQTTECDMYAMGGVILHVMSGIPPWGQTRQIKVIAEVAQGKTPRREEHTIVGYDLLMAEAIWNLIHWCWSFNPPDRPQSWEAREALVYLQRRGLEITGNNLAVDGNSLEASHPNHAGDVTAFNVHHLEAPYFRPVIQLQPNASRGAPASTLEPQYNQARSLDDLSAKIKHCRRALNRHPPGHPYRHTSLNNLGSALATRFDRDHNPADLFFAIKHHWEALDLRPPGHPHRSLSLNNLGYALVLRYDRDHNPVDLALAIEHHREALGLCPPGHSYRDWSLEGLGSALWLRYDRDYNPNDLSAVLEYLHESLDLRPPGHSSRSLSLNNLGIALQARYDRDHNLVDLALAIEYHREALNLRPPSHPHRSLSLDNLGRAFKYRYNRDRNPIDLSLAVEHHREALDLNPPGHAWRGSVLCKLGCALRSRYNRGHDPVDLSTAIELLQEAHNLRPPGHPHRHWSLDNLGYALQSRYDRDHDLTDVLIAIKHHREALDLRPPGHPYRDLSLHNIGSTLYSRYNQRQHPIDLSPAIEHFQEALVLRPPGHPTRDILLNDLGSALQSRYDRDRNTSDLLAAIEHYRDTLTLRPLGHPDHFDTFVILARALRSKHSLESKPHHA